MEDLSPSDGFGDIDGAMDAYDDGVQETLSAVIAHIERAQKKGYELETVKDSIKSKFALWESKILDTEALLESLEDH